MAKPSEHFVPARQRVLQQRYREAPEQAWISDHARAVEGDASDSFHGDVEPANNGGQRWRYGIHRAVGGDHDVPNPGDLLCAAQAACLHSTTRMLAEWLDVEIINAEVAVSAEVDVRGALMVDPSVPVCFQRIHCDVLLEVPVNTPGKSLKALMGSAERCCPVFQTLQGGTEVVVDWHIDQAVGPESNEVRHETGAHQEARS